MIKNIKVGDIATFDNPKNPYARWGKVLKIENDKVKLSYIGYGDVCEIQAIQMSISEV